MYATCAFPKKKKKKKKKKKITSKSTKDDGSQVNTIHREPFVLALQKHAYSNILKIVQPKTGKFPDKTYDIFHISAQNIDCGYSLESPRRGGSNEYPQSMF